MEKIILSGLVILFSAGVAWGVGKQTLKALIDRENKMEKDIEKVGNADKITRSYLFKEDGTAIYMPAATCMQSHSEIKDTLHGISKKLDDYRDEVLKVKYGKERA